LKIHHFAIVDNIDFNLCAKFGDDGLWNEKALVGQKSDNHNPKKNNNNKKNNVLGHIGDSSPGPKSAVYSNTNTNVYYGLGKGVCNSGNSWY